MPYQNHESSGSNSGYCFADFSMLWISKIEILSSDPLVVYFHDLLSKDTIRQIVEEANPRLEVPRTVSSKDRTIKSTSSKRSGKVAFISHQGHLKVSVLYRYCPLTSLAVKCDVVLLISKYSKTPFSKLFYERKKIHSMWILAVTST